MRTQSERGVRQRPRQYTRRLRDRRGPNGQHQDVLRQRGRHRVEFNGEDDFGSTVRLNNGDAVVSVASCIDNLDEPGWYSISGSTTGVTDNGERKTVSGGSHYFWICDCEDEQVAREQLGPPPSEPEPTETPDEPTTESGEGSDGGADGTQDGDQDAASTDEGSDGETTDGAVSTTGDETETVTPESTSASNSGSGGGSNAGLQSAAGADEASWQDHRVQTPTLGTGDGFGGLVALAAFVGVAILFYRRS